MNTLSSQTFADLKQGQRIVADPVYGVEEVVSVDRLSLSEWGPQGKDAIVHVGLSRDSDAGVRFVARFPSEPCITTVRKPQA